MRLCGFVLVLPALAAPARSAGVVVDASRQIATVPAGIYGAGYNGWGDITDPRAVERLKELPLRFIRVGVDPALICGEEPGEYDLQYAQPRDVGVGFLDRLKLIQEHGWQPLLALEISHSLPPRFHGDPTDGEGKPWFRFDTGGAFHEEGFGNQFQAWTGIIRDITSRLEEAGLSGLHWETAYELGHTMPLAEIHYYGALGIKEADATARCMGPATWPGWTVEERFVKPYLTQYGPELLDYASVHWYASNEHGLWDTDYDPATGTVTMADRLWLQYLMEVTPKFGPWCTSLRRLLSDPALNPGGKAIGVAVTEMDANAYSPYMRTPPNPKHPDYDPAADCYVNTNVFGAVWNASAICSLMKSGACDIAMKFNTRQYYGIIDHDEDGAYMRTPVWDALYLLSRIGGFEAGAPICHAEVSGPTDAAVDHVGGQDSPWIECIASLDADGGAIVLINRGLGDEDVEVSIENLPNGDFTVRHYLLDASHCQRFIGRPPDQEADGHFESEERSSCLDVYRKTRGSIRDHVLEFTVDCPAISLNVLVVRLA